MKNLSLLLKVSAILWIIWGLVHILAGVLTVNFVLAGDIATSISGIADAIDPGTVQMS